MLLLLLVPLDAVSNPLSSSEQCGAPSCTHQQAEAASTFPDHGFVLLAAPNTMHAHHSVCTSPRSDGQRLELLLLIALMYGFALPERMCLTPRRCSCW